MCWAGGIVRAMERLARRVARQQGAPWMTDDLTQIGLEVACRLAETYDPRRGAFSTYVHPFARGAMGRALARERALYNRTHAEDEADKSPRADRAADDTPNVEERLLAEAEARDHRALLARCLRELAPAERRLVEECALRGRPVSTVCAEVGLGVRTAGRRLKRILERIGKAGGRGQQICG